jgi:hypothetical protein
VFWIASAPRLRADFGNFHQRLQRMQEDTGRNGHPGLSDPQIRKGNAEPLNCLASDFIYVLAVRHTKRRRWHVLINRLSQHGDIPKRGCGQTGQTQWTVRVRASQEGIMAETNHCPAATLIRSRCLELGLNEAHLVRLAGYKNEAKGIRRLNSLIAGDLETTRWLIQKLPAALNLSTDVISGVIEQTRQQIASMKRCEAEQAGMEWRENFQPHAIILTERTRPEPIFCGQPPSVRRGCCVSILIWTANVRATSKNLWKGSNAG